MSVLRLRMSVRCAHRLINQVSRHHPCFASTAAAVQEQSPLQPPPADGRANKEFGPKIAQIVEQIAQLTLLEVSDLNAALKQRLNLPDAPMMSMTAMPAVAAPKVDETAAEPASTIKTSFTVRLVKYDETKKIAIIKEVKNLVPGLNLVQAKKFVESLPQIIKEDASNDEADQLKKKLAEIGAIVEIA